MTGKQVLCFVGVVFAGGMIWGLIFPDEEKHKAHEHDHEKLYARIACRDAVKERLRAPATADFEGLVLGAWRVTIAGDGVYIVSSHVDSPNGFGAQIRTAFTCTVTHPDTARQEVTVMLGE